MKTRQMAVPGLRYKFKPYLRLSAVCKQSLPTSCGHNVAQSESLAFDLAMALDKTLDRAIQVAAIKVSLLMNFRWLLIPTFTCENY